MAFTFRPATRENVGLLIGLSGSSGSGKTFTAMRLAKGIAGDAPFCLVDTEAGRSRHYSDRFRFDVGDLAAPFTPARYAEAITAADDAKYPVIVVDSMSHEWAGDGGILDWQEEELERMSKGNADRREAVKMAAWIKPKMAHKQMVQRLLQVRAHLVLCFRAEPKIEMVRDGNGKMQIVEKKSLTGLHGWIPICEKNLPYELTASFLLMADKPGVPLPIKLQEQHKALFPLDRVITEESGAEIAAWARGGVAGRDRVLGTVAAPAAEPDARSPAAGDWSARIEQATTPAALKAIVADIDAIKGTFHPDALASIKRQLQARGRQLGGARKPTTPPSAEEIFR
jgi:hypothetical protein